MIDIQELQIRFCGLWNKIQESETKTVFLMENKTKQKNSQQIFKQIQYSWIWVIWRIRGFESTYPGEIQVSVFDICWSFHNFTVTDIHFSAFIFTQSHLWFICFIANVHSNFTFCRESPRVITSILVIILIACLHSCLNSDAFYGTQF